MGATMFQSNFLYQARGWIWPTSHSLPTPGLSSPGEKNLVYLAYMICKFGEKGARNAWFSNFLSSILVCSPLFCHIIWGLTLWRLPEVSQLCQLLGGKVSSSEEEEIGQAHLLTSKSHSPSFHQLYSWPFDSHLSVSSALFINWFKTQAGKKEV